MKSMKIYQNYQNFTNDEKKVTEIEDDKNLLQI